MVAETAAPTPSFERVGPDHAGQRIDNFLLRLLKGVPRTRIYSMLRRGEVRVNRGRVKADYRVAAGDEIRLPPLRRPEESPSRSGPPPTAIERVRAAIIHEDRHLIVLDKPAGMAVHGGSGLSFGAIELLRAARTDCETLELVHRLDRETSGCLLIAKDRASLRELHAGMRDGGIDKHYLALLGGRWKGGAVEVDAPLAKNVLAGGERIVRTDPDGRAARTRFTPRERFGAATLVEATLMSGRTHQIRVHAAAIDRPLAGDPKYGDRDFNARLRRIGLKRMFLHAERLAFELRGRRHQIEAPLPDELQQTLDRLRRDGI